MVYGAVAYASGPYAGPTAAIATPAATDLPLVSVQVAFTTNPGDTPVWTVLNESKDVLRQFTVNRGRSTELDRFQAGRVTITLANEDRRFDPTFGPASQYVDLPGASGNYASTPDSPAVSITGDIDIRVKVALDDWTPAAITQTFMGHQGTGDPNRAWLFQAISSGSLQLTWFPLGTLASAVTKVSTVPTGFVDGTTNWVRVVHDVDNGAGGNDVKFYTSPDGVTWTQLGTTLTTAGAAVRIDSIDPLAVGARNNGTNDFLSGNIYYAELRSGIDGAVVAKFDPNTLAATAGTRTPASWTSATGEVWTVNGSAWAWGGAWGSPYYPNVIPMRRIRILANYGGVDYSVFSGYVDSWEQQYMPPQDAVCVIQATDAFKFLSNAEMLSSGYAETVQSANPALWWRLGDPSGSLQAVESITGNYPLVPVNSPVFGSAGLVTGDPNGAVEFTDADTPNSSNDGLQGIFPEGTYPITTGGSVELIFAVRGLNNFGPRFSVATLGSDGGPLSGLDMASGVTIQPVILNSAGTSFNAFSSIGVEDGLPHHVVITWAVGQQIRIYIDGIDQTATSDVVTGTLSNTTSKWLVGINSIDYPPFVASGFESVNDEFALYTRVLTADEVAAHAAAAKLVWSGDKSGARVNRILDFTPWPATDRAVDTGVSTLGPATFGGSSLSMLQKVEETEQGALFATKDGSVRFMARDMMISSVSNGVFGDGTGELEYADLVYVYDDQLIFNDVQVTREDGITQVAGDAASQAKYLRRSKVFDGMLYSTDAEARGLGGWWITHYKDPLLRATNMRLEPSAGNALTHYPHVLGRELMDRVGVKRRPQNLGAAIDQETLIEGITHDVTPDQWITTWNLSPANTQIYWLAEIAGRGEAGVTTVAGF